MPFENANASDEVKRERRQCGQNPQPAGWFSLNFKVRHRRRHQGFAFSGAGPVGAAGETPSSETSLIFE